MMKVIPLAIWELKRILRGPLFWLTLMGLILGLTVASFGAREGVKLIFTPSFFQTIPKYFKLFEPRPKAVGVVDSAQFLKMLPPVLPPVLFYKYPSEEAAKDAIRAGVIEGFFEIEEGFPDTGEIRRTPGDWFPAYSFEFGKLVRFNLLNADPELDREVDAVLNLPFQKLDASGNVPSLFSLLTETVQRILTFSWVFLCIVAFTFFLGWIEEAFNGEKDSLTLEILLTSVRPTEVVVAKFLGLYAAMALQSLMISLFFRIWIPSLTSLQLPLAAFLWRMYSWQVLLCAAYLFLTNVMFLGLKLRRVKSYTREEKSGALLFFAAVTACLMFPVASICALSPGSFVAWSLSLFPLTSPVAMIIRLIHGPVPAEEIFLSLAILCATAIGSMRSWRRSLVASFD